MKNQKIIISVLILVVVAVGAIVLTKNNVSSPETVTREFYKQFITDIDNDGSYNGVKINPNLDTRSKQYIDSLPFSEAWRAKINAVGQSFRLAIEEQPGEVPEGFSMSELIICGQDYYEFSNFTFSILTQSDSSAIVNVAEGISGSQLSWHVNLVLEGGQWKIDNIVCPK